MFKRGITRLSKGAMEGIEAIPSNASNSCSLLRVDLTETTPRVPSIGENDFSTPGVGLKRGVVSVVIMISNCFDSFSFSSKTKPPRKTLHLDGT